MKATFVKDISKSGLTPPQYVLDSFAMVGCTYFMFSDFEVIIWPEIMCGSFNTASPFKFYGHRGRLYFHVEYWDGKELRLDVVDDFYEPYPGEWPLDDLRLRVAYCLGYLKIKTYDSFKAP